MTEPNGELRVILIGGSSSVGKSTLADSLAGKLGWTCLSTDKLARHPGRPWKTDQWSVPEHVAEHYLSLSVDDLLVDVLRHYRGMWRGVKTRIADHATDPSRDRLILEGSALWPESVAELDSRKVAAVWLTASDELFRARIHSLSSFEEASAREKSMIQKFLERTLLYNERMMDAVGQLGLVSMNVEAASSLDELCDAFLELLRKNSLHAPDRDLHRVRSVRTDEL